MHQLWLQKLTSDNDVSCLVAYKFYKNHILSREDNCNIVESLYPIKTRKGAKNPLKPS